MNEGKFSFFKAPAQPYIDNKGKEHPASLTPASSVTVKELYTYITRDPHAKKVTESFRQFLQTDKANDTVPTYGTKKEGGKRVFFQNGNTDCKQAFKNRMFCFITARGIFSYKSSKKFVTPSNYVCIDFDHFCATPEEVEKAKDRLLDKNLPCTPILIFTSPSGDGLKCLYHFPHVEDEEESTARLKGLFKFLQESFPEWEDKSKPGTHALDELPDLARGCNIPHDPKARYNPDAKTSLDWSVWRVDPKPYTPAPFIPGEETEMKVKYYAEELIRNRIDVTGQMNFNDYLGLAYSFKQMTHGRELFLQVSSLWPRYTENNSLKVWSYTDRQAPKTDITYFISLARKAGVPSWESATEEGKDSARAYMKSQDPKETTVKAVTKTPDGKQQPDKAEELVKGIVTPEEIKKTVFAQEGEEAPCFNDFMKVAGSVTKSIPTQYSFKGEALTLPGEAITIIGAQTSHGKTRFLENLILNTCDQEGEGAVLFFSLEETLSEVLAELVNIHTNIKGLCPAYSKNNIETLRAVFKRESTGERGHFPHDEPTPHNKRKPEETFAFLRGRLVDFFRHYVRDKGLRIYENEIFREVDILCQGCKIMAEKRKIKAVFIDHVGMLYETEATARNFLKTERVERIFTKLEQLAKDLVCPVVLTQQLNRPSEGALSMNNTNLSDSADSERSANTIVLLWNSQDIPTKTKENDVDKLTTPKPLLEYGFEYGTPGTIFARLSKRRGGSGKNSFNVFSFEGDTGLIREMKPEEVKKKQELFRPENKNTLCPKIDTGQAPTNNRKAQIQKLPKPEGMESGDTGSGEEEDPF